MNSLLASTHGLHDIETAPAHGFDFELSVDFRAYHSAPASGRSLQHWGIHEQAQHYADCRPGETCISLYPRPWATMLPEMPLLPT